jgi:hypothetical protein
MTLGRKIASRADAAKLPFVFYRLGSIGVRTPHLFTRVSGEPKPQGPFLKEVATMHAEAANTRFTTSSDH